MSDKIYTAKEMREAADTFWVGGVICEVKDEDGRVVKHIKHDAIIAMLRQAADALDREERRKKEYEYSYMFLDGTVASAHRESPRMVFGDTVHGRTVVRREVGEWEDVNDGE